MSEDEKVNKSLATQIAKYGGVEGYRAEMARRRKLGRSGFASMDRDKLIAAARLGGLNSRKNKQIDKQVDKDAGKKV